MSYNEELQSNNAELDEILQAVNELPGTGNADNMHTVELVESFTLTEDTSSIIRDRWPDGTPYEFKTFFAEIQTNTVMSKKWIQFCGYYDKPFTQYGYNGANVVKYHKPVYIYDNGITVAVHTGLLEINGIIMHLASSGHTLRYYHAGDLSQLSIAEDVLYNIHSAKIVKIQINSEIPLVAGTKILLYGVR